MLRDAALTAAADTRFPGHFSEWEAVCLQCHPWGRDTLQSQLPEDSAFKDGLFNSHTDPTVLSAPRPAHLPPGCTLSQDVLLFKIFELLPYRAPPYGKVALLTPIDVGLVRVTCFSQCSAGETARAIFKSKSLLIPSSSFIALLHKWQRL